MDLGPLAGNGHDLQGGPVALPALGQCRNPEVLHQEPLHLHLHRLVTALDVPIYQRNGVGAGDVLQHELAEHLQHEPATSLSISEHN